MFMNKFNVLMSTPDCKKDSLLRQVLHVQNPKSIFGQFGFFLGHPLERVKILQSVRNMFTPVHESVFLKAFFKGVDG